MSPSRRSVGVRYQDSALGFTLSAIEEAGLSVPGDVSIVGYDDVPLAAWPAYDLTTIRQPVRRMVDATIDALIAQIEGDEEPRKVQIDGPLIIRGSAKTP